MSSKRQITQRRRLQNQQAQKNYRERQKKHLELLQNLTGYNNGFPVNASRESQGSAGDVRETTSLAGAEDQPQPSLTSFNLPDASGSCGSKSESYHNKGGQRNEPIMPILPGSTHSIIFHDRLAPSSEIQVMLGSPCSVYRTNDEPNLNFPERLQGWSMLSHQDIIADASLRRQISENQNTLEDIIKAGLRALSHNESTDIYKQVSPEAGKGEERLVKAPTLSTDKIVALRNLQGPMEHLPDIHKNNFRVKQLMFVAACDANLSALGFSYADSISEDSESPFFKEAISHEIAVISCSRDFPHLKPYLQPCTSQLIHSHHPYIDVLPFPTFRERIIALISTEPPMIDEDEFCHDLQNDGLICWGSSLGGGSSAVGSGAPWDLRSWEAQPWFMKKWWILLGGKDGELYQQTRWWCEMRGEKACYPW